MPAAHQRRILLAESEGDVRRWQWQRQDQFRHRPAFLFELTVATPDAIDRLDVRLPWWADATLILITRTDTWQHRQQFINKLMILRRHYPRAVSDPTGLLPIIKPLTPERLRDKPPIIKGKGPARKASH